MAMGWIMVVEHKMIRDFASALQNVILHLHRQVQDVDMCVCLVRWCFFPGQGGSREQQNIGALAFSEVIVGFYLDVSGHHFACLGGNGLWREMQQINT
jgi:hypothetical protein